MHDLTAFQRDLLFVVAGKSKPAGVAIKDEIEEYYEKKIHYGRLYPNLDTLIDKGLVEKEEERRTDEWLHNHQSWASRASSPVRLGE